MLDANPLRDHTVHPRMDISRDAGADLASHTDLGL
jgi:hypothetical protein